MAPTSSQLQSSSDRLLAGLIDHAFEAGWRTPDDFLRHFGAADLIQALSTADALRARLLAAATGVHEKIAVRKSIASASEDLQIALDEGTTSGADLLRDFPTDDRVRYLSAGKLWAFLIEGDFFRVDANDSAHARALARVMFTLRSALEQELLTLTHLIDGIGMHELAGFLPEALLRRVLVGALESGRNQQPLSESRLLELVPLEELLRHVPLAHVWSEVIVNRVAKPAGWTDPNAPPPAPSGARKSSAGAPGKPPPRAGIPSASGPRAAAGVPSDPALAKPTVLEAVPVPPPAPPPEALAGTALDDSDLEEGAADVVARLRALGRLPEDFEQLPLPVLYSIESMYADLAGIEEDEDKIAVIEESFPNQTLLRQAMLALIRLLDPGVDTTDPVMQNAEMRALVRIVLAEERRRERVSRHSGMAPAEAGTAVPAIPSAGRTPSNLEGSNGSSNGDAVAGE